MLTEGLALVLGITDGFGVVGFGVGYPVGDTVGENVGLRLLFRLQIEQHKSTYEQKITTERISFCIFQKSATHGDSVGDVVGDSVGDNVGLRVLLCLQANQREII